VALALDALLRAGTENAASHIEWHHKTLRGLCDKKSTIAGAARQWRDAFSAGDVKDVEATIVFKTVRPSILSLDPALCFEKAKAILREAESIAANFR
jgi:hypothetical protein